MSPHRLHTVPDSDEAPAPAHHIIAQQPGEAIPHPPQREIVSVPQSQGGGQLDGMPLWAKMGATLSAISIISGLLVYLVINQVQSQNAAAATVERLLDKFDAIIEKHDARIERVMGAHGDKINAENEKTRTTITVNAEKNGAALETVVNVLKQIRDEKRMP